MVYETTLALPVGRVPPVAVGDGRRGGSASGQREPDADLPVVDLPSAVEAELPVEGPRFALARLVTGQQLGGALRPNQVDDLGQHLAADPAPLVPLVDEHPPQIVAPLVATG